MTELLSSGIAYEEVVVPVATLTAAGTQTTTTPNFNNLRFGGLKLVIDITAATGTGPTLAVTLQGFDPVSGKVWTILASAASGAVATTILTVFPGAAVTANVSANDQIPRFWNVKYVIAGTTPAVTATIAAHYLI